MYTGIVVRLREHPARLPQAEWAPDAPFLLADGLADQFVDGAHEVATVTCRPL
jgi:hypothetical protein